MTEADDESLWGELAEPDIVGPPDGAAAFSALTWHTLAWLSRHGLRPEPCWHDPQIVLFGAGSGWLWGELVVSKFTGAMRSLHAYWVDRGDNQRLSTVYEENAIWRELLRHEAERVERVTWLAHRHGLIVRSP